MRIRTFRSADLQLLRILDEEEMLRAELDGYPDYMRTVRYRLAPGLW